MTKKLLSRFSSMKGFTMVELMIVIAIIGIIAVAVLSAINPVEQINKGKDTRTRSDASELLNAMERMYATDEAYPFYDSANTWVAGRVTRNAADTADMNEADVATFLVTQSELKNGFDTRITAGDEATYNSIYIYRGLTADALYVCFEPSSAQFTREAATKCTDNGAAYDEADARICTAPAGSKQLFCMP